MESLIAGMACKLYDDLKDNPLLKKYRNKSLMESLKIVHSIFFTIISLKDSTFYYLFCFSILLNVLSNPTAYTHSYERSMLWVYPLLFFFMKSPTSISKIEIWLVLLFLSTNIAESYYSQEEYSYVKCLIRLYFCLLSIGCYFLSTSQTLHHLMFYFAGYFGISFCVQLYSINSKLKNMLKSRFMKGKTDRKTIHYTNK